MPTTEMTLSSAVISDCGRYRYTLERRWDAALPLLHVCMLNPSTADASVNDPTITRLITRAGLLGYGGIVVTNLFALRSTDPALLRGDVDPIGPENDGWIARSAARCASTIVAWGEDGTLYKRAEVVLAALQELNVHLTAIKLNKSGQPAHPLYLKMTDQVIAL